MDDDDDDDDANQIWELLMVPPRPEWEFPPWECSTLQWS